MQFDLRNQRKQSTEGNPGSKSSKVRKDVRTWIDAEHDEEEEPGEYAAQDVACGLRALAPEGEGMDTEQTQCSHHHAGSADSPVRSGGEDQACHVAASTGEVGDQQSDPSPKSRH